MATDDRPVRVRIAPSPTGDPHVGTAYIALFNYVFAKKHGGKFVLRIEDTDQTRARADSEQMIFDALRWVGLSWDEGPDVGGPYAPYRQSERTHFYRDHAGMLLQNGAAYRCFCTEDRLAKLRIQQQAEKRDFLGYDRHCRDLDPAESRNRAAAGEPHVIRLKMPTEGEVAFHDELRGTVARPASNYDDQVLLKSDGFPTYHMANVVDDHLMQITHVIRAEEWVSSTGKHVVLYDAFGWPRPKFIHMPLLRNTDKSKISKRKNPVSINYYRDAGILPRTLLNFLGLMGWSFGGDREKFTLAEMVDVFSWDRMSLGGPVFDLKKLTWLNEQYIKELSVEDLADALIEWRLNKDFLVRLLPLYRERMKRFDDLLPQAEFFFAGDLDYTTVLPKMVVGDAEVPPKELATAILELVERFEARDGWDAAMLEEEVTAWSAAHGWKKTQMLLRCAVTGRTASPGLYETMAVLGKEITRRRLRNAAEVIVASAPKPPPAPKPAKVDKADKADKPK